MERNKTITDARKKVGLTQWRLAELLNIREDTLSRKLRHNLPEKEVNRILKVIEEYGRCKDEKETD